jgi:hypothetical protein
MKPAETELAANWETRYREVLARISAACARAGRDPSEVRLIAVSKGQPVEAIEALYRLGHRDFGENYVQELVAKAERLTGLGESRASSSSGETSRGIRWHLIGHLQTNKAKQVVPWVYRVHSVDSAKLATDLSRRQTALFPGRTLSVLLQVNIDGEESKSGVDLGDLGQLSRLVHEIRALPGLSLDGLMCIPERSSAHGSGRSPFAKLRELAGELGVGPELSMGMSGDFEEAIAQGATAVRVGTALFGERSKK